MSDPRKALGKTGEDMALQYLQDLGYKLKERNYQIRSGEIDLIMTDEETLVFIEVRTKSSSFFGSPLETVNNTKRRKIINVAKFYLHRFYGNSEIDCRFDVIGIVLPSNNKADITHIEGAFFS